MSGFWIVLQEKLTSLLMDVMWVWGREREAARLTLGLWAAERVQQFVAKEKNLQRNKSFFLSGFLIRGLERDWLARALFQTG